MNAKVKENIITESNLKKIRRVLTGQPNDKNINLIAFVHSNLTTGVQNTLLTDAKVKENVSTESDLKEIQ